MGLWDYGLEEDFGILTETAGRDCVERVEIMNLAVQGV